MNVRCATPLVLALRIDYDARVRAIHTEGELACKRGEVFELSWVTFFIRGLPMIRNPSPQGLETGTAEVPCLMSRNNSP